MGAAFFRTTVFLIFAFLLLPVLYVVLSSFSKSAILAFPPTSFTLDWYGHIPLPYWDSLKISVKIGVAAMLISTFLGTGIALAIARWRGAGSGWFSAFCLSPLMVPPLVIGAALFQSSVAFKAWTGIAVGGSMSSVVVGHVVLTIPLVIRSVLAAHAHFDPSLEEASLNLGAGPIRTFFNVTLRGLLPGITSGAIFAFLLSLDDVPIAIFLGPGDRQTLPVKIFSVIEYSFDPSLMAVSSILVLGTVLLMLLADKIVGLDVAFGLKGR